MRTKKHEWKLKVLFAFTRVCLTRKIGASVSEARQYGALLLLLSLTACGYIGNPMPPTLDMPQTINDVHFAEIGDKILVEFTVPAETTEGLPLKNLKSLDLRIGTIPNPWSDEAWAASAQRFAPPATGPGPQSIWVPPSDVSKWIGKEVVIRARATGPKGKTSDWSAVKTLPVQPPLAVPADLNIENKMEGFNVVWKSPATHFRVYRAVGDAQPELRGEPTQPSFPDPDVEFGVKYKYYVQAVAGEFQQSEMADSQPKTRADEFTPTVPAGLTAQQGPSSIELSWERNTDPRFQGYNVYRSVDGGAVEKIASLVTAPAYSDRPIEIGKRYVYTVSAVGVNGRESERSATYSIAAQ
jgi:hypothetical protein